MIETTLGQVVMAEEALRRLADQKLDVRTSYHLAKLAKLITAESEIFNQKRLAIFKEHGDSRPPKTDAERAQFGDSVIEIKPEHVETVARLMKELFDVPVSLPWTPVKLGRLNGAQVSPLDMLKME